jgi:hypothetical protein
MADTESNRSPDSRGSSGWLVIFCVVAPLLYVLSIGPAAALVSRANNGRNAASLRKIYAPVIWLHDHTVLKKPLEAYVELWGVK